MYTKLDMDQAIARANALPYGSAGYAFSRSAATANRITEPLEVAVIGINHGGDGPETPAGRIGNSRRGREGGIEALESRSVRQSVSLSAKRVGRNKERRT